MNKDFNLLLKKFLKLKKINKKKTLDLHSPYFSKIDNLNLKNCIKSNYVATGGVYSKKFIDEIKKITKSKYVVLTNSGSSATYLALRSLDLKADTEVLIPSLNYISNINAIISLGAHPHFIDSEINSLGIDLYKLDNYFQKKFLKKGKKYINKTTKKVLSGIICTHIFGNTNNVNKLKKFCSRKNIFLIEDSSEALGSKFKKRSLGTFGDAGLLSFNGNKIITSGGGGALITNNKKVYIKSRHLSQNAKMHHPWKYKYDDLGYNISMPNLNASLGFSQILRLKKNIRKKKTIYKFYKKEFSDLKFLKILNIDKNLQPNYWLITFLLNDASFNKRNELIELLNLHNIKARPIWQLLHKIKDYKKYQSMSLDNAINLEKRIINFPSSVHLRIKN